MALLMVQVSCKKDYGQEPDIVTSYTDSSNPDRKERIYWSYNYDDAQAKFEYFFDTFDCVILKASSGSGFPQQNSVRYEIYRGYRDDNGDCIY